MDNTKIVAFDCFDTLVHRDCHPEVVLYCWSREMSAEYKFIFSPEEIYRRRKTTEYALKENAEDISYDLLIGTVFDTIVNDDLLDIKKEDFVLTSYDIEKNIELSHLFIDKSNVDLFKKIYREGKRNVVITDFYLPKLFFEEMFEYFDLSQYISDVFVSSEIGMRKDTGNLYRFVLKELGISASEILMVGDNKNSDYKIPQALGISTIRVPYITSYHINTKSNLSKQINLISKSKKGNYFSGYVGTLLLFSERLYQFACKNNVDILMFCSREGQNLKKLFEIYQEIFYPHHQIRTQYLYVSRRSTLLPSLKSLDEEKFERIFRQYSELKTVDFLKSIGFDEHEILKIEEDGINLCGTIASGNNELQRLKSCEAFVCTYDRNRTEQKTLFSKYIYSLNDNNTSSIFLVDIGWKGTIQDNIHEILGSKTTIWGFYYGLFKHDMNEKNIKMGLMFDEEQNSKYFELFTYNYVDLEKVFAADHGQTIKYNKSEGKVIPVISNKSEDTEIYMYTCDWQNLMNDAFKKLCNEFWGGIISAEMMEQNIARTYLGMETICRPKFYEIYLDLRVKTRENFGNISGPKIKNDASIERDKRMKGRFMYVEYIYRILDRLHLGFLSPIAGLYCRLVYFVMDLGLLKAKPVKDYNL